MAELKSLTRRICKRLEFESFRAWGYTLSSIRGNGTKAYWWREVSNFGDLITPLLLRHYGRTAVHECPARAQFVAAGSILEVLPEDFNGSILGAGFIRESSRCTFPNARIIAVRGVLTRERLGYGHKTASLGDPGLLASITMRTRAQKKFLVGIIPHHEAKEKPLFARLAEKYEKDITVIDVKRPPLEVFTAIDECSHILSSSLHGLIVSDSLGVPNGWIFSEGMLGGRFKFDDYYSALRVSVKGPVTLTGNENLSQLVSFTASIPSETIEEMKLSLHKLWCEKFNHNKA